MVDLRAKPYRLSGGDAAWVRAAIASMTDEEKVGQLLFCAAPGGMSDTPLIAMDMGADSSVVAVMQFVRMLFGMACLPTVIMLSDRLIEPETAKALEANAAQSHITKRVGPKPTLRGFLPTMCAAFAAAEAER